MHNKNVDSLWKHYKKYNHCSSRNQLLENYQPFIKKIARKFYSRMPNLIDVSDLESYANMGLMDAIEKFDIKRQIKFEAYATTRVKGAIIDGLRKQDWLPKTLRSKMKKEEQEENSNGSSGNGRIKENVQKRYMLMSLDDPKFQKNNNYSKNEYQNIENDSFLISTPDFVDKTDNRICLLKAVGSLNKKEKKIVYQYYFKGRTLREIGKMMQITESRVSQIHKDTLKKLKNNLKTMFPLISSAGLLILSVIRFSLFHIIR